MVATGMFYGIEQTTMAKDIVASFMMSLMASSPGFIISIMFTWTGPGEVMSTKRPKRVHVSANSGSLSHSNTGSMTESHQSQHSQSEGTKSVTKSMTKSEMSVIEKKIDDLEKMRKHFYDYNFPFPPITRKIAWVVLVIWSSAAVVTAVCVLTFTFSVSL